MRLIAEGRGDRASIAEITEEADIGFGSFYNHFDSKEQLFQTASEEVLERWGQLIDRATVGITDPAERFAAGTRISGRLGWTHPDIAGFLTGAGLGALDIPGGLAPRALRDIEAGQAAGRFTVPDPQIALSAVAGGLIGLLRMCQRHPRPWAPPPPRAWRPAPCTHPRGASSRPAFPPRCGRRPDPQPAGIRRRRSAGPAGRHPGRTPRRADRTTPRRRTGRFLPPARPGPGADQRTRDRHAPGPDAQQDAGWIDARLAGDPRPPACAPWPPTRR